MTLSLNNEFDGDASDFYQCSESGRPGVKKRRMQKRPRFLDIFLPFDEVK